MPKSAKSQKQVLINIGVLVFGVIIGSVFSTFLKHSPPEVKCADNSSLAVEPSVPTLTAPIFKEPGTIYSSKDGLILVRWNEVNGASQYNVRVWDENGTELKNFTTKRSFTFLKKLPVDPAQKETPYHVIVTPLDDKETRGQDSEKKMIAMLPLRNLDPPTIKSIQTEAEEDPK